MTVRAEISSSPAAPGPGNAGAASGLPTRAGVRLRALVLIRWAAVAGQLFTAAVVHWGLRFGLPVLAVGGTIALSALLNLTVSLGRPASARIDDREATIFLAFDILQLAVLLYLTGGLINPFSLLLLAPVAWRHHPVAHQQRRAVAAHYHQHRPARPVPSALAVARPAAGAAGDLPGRRLGRPHPHHAAGDALWLAAGRGAAPDVGRARCGPGCP